MLWKHRCPCLQCQRRSPCMRKYPHWSSASRHCIRCMSMSHRQQYLDTQHHTNSLRWPPLRQLRSCQSCPYMLCRTSMQSMSMCPHHNQCKLSMHQSPSQLYQPHSQCKMSSPEQHTDRWSSWRMVWKHGTLKYGTLRFSEELRNLRDRVRCVAIAPGVPQTCCSTG